MTRVRGLLKAPVLLPPAEGLVRELHQAGGQPDQEQPRPARPTRSAAEGCQLCKIDCQYNLN